MRISRRLRIAITGVALGGSLLTAGCTPSGAAAERASGNAATTDYLPLRPGMSWTYRASDGQGRSRNVETRVEGRAVWGLSAANTVFRVRSELLDGSVLRWERPMPGGVGCVQEEIRDSTGTITTEEAYDPPATVIDERPARLTAGAEWSETFMETTPNYRGHPKTHTALVEWTVESASDAVTVPAGTFTCLRVRCTRKHRAPIVSWYARGVGLVKELGAGPLGDETLVLVQATVGK